MKKKVVSLIMSVALAFSSMHVMNIAAENVKAESNLTEATVTNLNGYEFIDIASNGTTLVALTKNTARALGRLFYSTDNGVTWQPCQNQPLNSAATISSNKNSQQQLVYWKANNILWLTVRQVHILRKTVFCGLKIRICIGLQIQ